MVREWRRSWRVRRPARKTAACTTNSLPSPAFAPLISPVARALITGGSKGLGAAMAAGLASAGADVMIVSRHLEEAQATAETIAATWRKRALALPAT